MAQEPYYTDERLERLFENYLENESDTARNEISFLERLTGEQVVNALSKIEAKNLRLYEKER